MIEITNVCKNYDTGNKALKNVNITIDDGEFVFIIGRSGAGKSTLLKMLLKEVEPSSGKIVVNDMNLGKMPRRYIPKYRRRLGVVFQDFRLLKDRNVYENVAFAQRVIGASPRKIKERVPSMLQMADEPTGNLDHENAIEIMKLLDEINQMGTTVVVVTHSNEIVNLMQKRVITMQRGSVVQDQKGGFIHEN